MLKRHMVLILVVSCLAGYSIGLSYTSNGTITSDETWSPGDTIKITGDLRVQGNATLTIEAGTMIRGYKADLSEYWRWILYVSGSGAIQANGTEQDTIDFKAVCVEFDGLFRDEDNWLRYCKFTSGWGHAFVEFRNVSGSSELSTVTIDHCAFKANSYGMYVTDGGSSIIRYCTFEDQASGIFLHGGGVTDVSYTVFKNHSCGIINGSLGGNKMPWDPMVTRVNHCVFYNITGDRISAVTVANGYGICANNYPGSLFVHNSIFFNCENGGIRDWNIESTHFDENWVVTTDYNCYYEVNKQPLRLLPTGSNSIVNQDPLFTDPESLDFSLSSSSPCLNAANDGSHIGVWQGVAGIGRNSWQSPVGSWQTDKANGNIKIYDLHGKLIWDGRIPVGIYVEYSDGKNTVRKIVIVK